MTQMVRKHFIFSGRVQGVGFRATAFMLARRLGLTGWVRNTASGDVEMEAQGFSENIDRMLVELNNDRYIRITEIDMKDMKVDPDEMEFGFRF
ncbi:MAG: acylphosphatase [Lachnospiraceae bacterium]|nr:acylphosphatase [Lachnospiraceae bacterium]